MIPPPRIPEYWEIWNEENYGINGDDGTEAIDPQRYGVLLHIAHEVITQKDENAKVVLGGLLAVGSDPGERPKMPVGTYIQQLHSLGFGDDYEVASLHPYAFRGVVAKHPNDPSEAVPNPTDKQDVEHVAELVRRNIRAGRNALKHGGKKEAGKEIWITEIGWPVNDGIAVPDGHHLLVSAGIQASLLNQTFNMIKEHSGSAERSYNIGKVFWYNIEDNPTGNVADWANNCGLLTRSGGKRPAWGAFKNQTE